jgi:hypothetical protein
MDHLGVPARQQFLLTLRAEQRKHLLGSGADVLDERASETGRLGRGLHDAILHVN